MSAHTQPIVIGTAGHIDHGKTALVRALTGIDTDRLKVEKERGITTELGFAHLDLGDQRFGVVDVPGHERFIKAMVAGAGGLDLVCLVIAADEGVMPQTREHLDICELLGVRRGVVALTKSDLVDQEWLELVAEEVRDELSETFLADARLIPVSAKTGDGLDELKSELLTLTKDLGAKSPAGAFRLPLDRVFTIRGFGTVVTGTVLGGRVRTGDAVVVFPQGTTAKVRGIENHGDSLDAAVAGMRCAINLSGISREALTRGDVLSHPEALTPSHILDARFRYLESARGPLKRQSRVLLHHATAQLMATLILVDRDELAPGEEALVQLRLDQTTPVAALPGDRFIARGFVIQEHYGTTLGGGEILRVQAPKVRRKATEAQEMMQQIAGAGADERVALEIKGAKVAGIGSAELGRRLGGLTPALREQINRLVQTSEVIRAGKGDGAVFCHAAVFARLEKQATDRLDVFHDEHPHKDGISREELRTQLPRALPPRLFDTLLETLARRNAVVVDKDLVRKKSRSAPGKQAAALSVLEEAITARYRGWGILAPKVKDVAGEVKADAKTAKAALDRLQASGVLVRVKSDYLVHEEAIATLRSALEAHLDEHGQLTPTEWKAITGASRKYSIPLAEFFDGEKLTLRVGDVRKRRG